MSAGDNHPEEDPERLVRRARALLGRPPGGLRAGRDPVNLPMVHHWCQALGDRNPAYLDEEHARSSSRGHLIAPPGMLQTWTMDAPRDPGDTRAEFLGHLDAAGYTSVVAVGYEHEYLRELRHGERISVRSSVEDLSQEKKTALGTGYFTTMRHEYLTDDGELVGVGRMRLLKFRPPASEPAADPPDTPAEGADGAAPEPSRAVPVVARDNRYFWDGVALGELRIQCCGGCGVLRHPPQPLCDRCGSTEQGHIVSAGHGFVYSFVVHHEPALPGVSAPHMVLLVELEEGVRIISELASGADNSAVRIGTPVRLEMKQLPGGRVVPAFRPAEEEAKP